MAGWIDPNADPFAQPQAPAYNYDTAAQQIAQKQGFARALQELGQQPQGQMVSGWYVAPSPWQHLAAALEKVAGGYMQGNASREEAALKQKDREETMKAYNSFLNGPSPDEEAAMKASAQEQAPANIFKPADPNTVGPFKSQAQIPAPNQAPVPTSLDASLQGAPAQMRAPVGFTPPPPAYAGTVVDPQAVIDVANKQDSLLARAKAAYTQDTIGALANTNGGQGLAQRILEAQVAKKLTPASGKDYKQVTDPTTGKTYFVDVTGAAPKVAFEVGGDGTNYKEAELGIKRRGLDIEERKAAAAEAEAAAKRIDAQATKDATAAEKARDNKRDDERLGLSVSEQRAKAADALANTQSTLSLIDGARAANDKWNAHGGVLSRARLAAGLAVGEEDAVKFQNSLKTIASLNVKDIFGGNPTDGERQALDAVVGSAAAGKAPTEAALKNLRDRVEGRHKANQQTYSQYDDQLQRVLPGVTPVSSAPAGLRAPDKWVR